MIYVLKRRVAQPQYPVSGDSRDNASSTLLISGATHTYNASKNLIVPVTPGGSGVSVRPTPKGKALNTPNGGWADYALNTDWAGANTVIAFVIINSIDSPWGGLFAKISAGVTTQFSVGRVDTTNNLYVGVNNSWAPAISGSSISALLGTPRVLTFTHSGVASTAASYYVDGVYIGATDTTSGTQETGSNKLLLGCARDASGTYDADVDWLFFQRFARVLTAAEISIISANVWASYAPQKRSIWVGVAGGGILTPSLFTDADTFYAATVTPGAVVLTPALFADSDTFYAATVAPGAVNLTPSLFVDSDTFHTPTVTAGAVDLTPSLYVDADTFYAATVVAGGALSPAVYVDADTFYSPIVAPGAVNLAPSLYTDADTFYSSSVTQGDYLLPSLFADSDTFYAPIVAPGAVNLTPSLFVDADTFYAATIPSDIVVAPAGGGGSSNTYTNPAGRINRVRGEAIRSNIALHQRRQKELHKRRAEEEIIIHIITQAITQGLIR